MEISAAVTGGNVNGAWKGKYEKNQRTDPFCRDRGACAAQV